MITELQAIAEDYHHRTRKTLGLSNSAARKVSRKIAKEFKVSLDIVRKAREQYPRNYPLTKFV